MTPIPRYVIVPEGERRRLRLLYVGAGILLGAGASMLGVLIAIVSFLTRGF